MRTTQAWILGLLAAVNGLFMLIAPDSWYPITPGVPDTGPFNQHFVRDIGCAFLVTGVSLVRLSEAQTLSQSEEGRVRDPYPLRHF